MKAVLILLLAVLTALTIMLLLPVISEWNFHFDAHGKYISPDGELHRESTSERHFFQFLLSIVLLSVTTILYFRNSQSPLRK